jgi:hypothetical protein
MVSDGDGQRDPPGRQGEAYGGSVEVLSLARKRVLRCREGSNCDGREKERARSKRNECERDGRLNTVLLASVRQQRLR